MDREDTTDAGKKNLGTTHEMVSKRFSKHLMEKYGLLRYTKDSRITTITIVYNADLESGWFTALSSDPIQIYPPDSYLTRNDE